MGAVMHSAPPERELADLLVEVLHLEVAASDIDPEAVRVTRENARLNGARVSVWRAAGVGGQAVAGGNIADIRGHIRNRWNARPQRVPSIDPVNRECGSRDGTSAGAGVSGHFPLAARKGITRGPRLPTFW